MVEKWNGGKMEWWKIGIMELWKTERKATAWRNIDSIDGQHEVWRCSTPEYPGKPQRGEMFVELAGNKGFSRCSAPEQEMELLGIGFYR